MLGNMEDEMGDSYLKKERQTQAFDSRTKACLSKLFANIKDFPEHYNDLSVTEQHEWIVQKILEEHPDVSEFIANLIPPSFRAGRLVEPTEDKPEWLDIEKFRRGQKFARDNLFGIFYSHLCALFLLLLFESGMKGLIFTRKSDTPYLAFKRYLSTSLRVRNWYTEDPWSKGTAAYKDIKTVQRMHLCVSRKIRELSVDEFNESTRIRDVCCPMWPALSNDLIPTAPQTDAKANCSANIMDIFHHEVDPINQHHMSTTQFGFASLIVLFPREFGAHYATKEDLEAYCHLWRAIGYLLGIEDEYNVCRGSMEEVTQRFQDYMEFYIKPNFQKATPEWEHMMTCIFEGLQYYVPIVTTTTAFLHLTDILNISTPHLRASISYSTWIKYYFVKFAFYYATMFSRVKRYLNTLLNKALNRADNYTEEKHAALEKKSTETIARLSSCFST